MEGPTYPMEIAPVCRPNPLPCLALRLSAENASAMSDGIPKERDPISGSPDQVTVGAGKTARSYSSVDSTSQIRVGPRVARSIAQTDAVVRPPVRSSEHARRRRGAFGAESGSTFS
jgi:hypothetical protein